MINLFDYEREAEKRVPPSHWGYIAGGANDEVTVGANRAAFDRILIRYRTMVDVTSRSLATTVLGTPVSMPVLVAPTAFHRLAHPEGEAATARAAGAAGTVMILSTLSNTPVEEVIAAAAGPVWFQLYPTNDWAITSAIVSRAERAGCPVLVLTVDNLGNNRLTQERFAFQDPRSCQSCHTIQGARSFVTRPMFSGLDMTTVARTTPFDWSWSFIDRLRAIMRDRALIYAA